MLIQWCTMHLHLDAGLIHTAGADAKTMEFCRVSGVNLSNTFITSSRIDNTAVSCDRPPQHRVNHTQRRLLLIALSDAQLLLSGTHYRKLSSIATLLLFFLKSRLRHSSSPRLSLFPLLTSTLPSPAPLKLRPYCAIQMCHYPRRYTINRA